ncbi:MAG: response regulator [Thermodesulfobacteriota bacterium]|nr:response regulator [Thermodesulfobacteriota bacterium]
MEDNTILIVDDEANILQALRRVFRREPYRVLTASSGAEGIEILEKEHVDLIISDQKMPEISGTQFLARAKELYPETIRIILSGYTDVNSITEAINVGNVYKFILKPWEDEVLRTTIRESLDIARLQRENKALSETIKKQNEELKYLNKNLGKEVENRIAEIKLQNEALKLARDILESLPIAVLGTDNEGSIVLVNSLARGYFEPEGQALLGSNLRHHFGKELIGIIADAINSEEQKEGQYKHTDGSSFDVYCIPLSRGNFEVPRSGTVISFLNRPRSH